MFLQHFRGTMDHWDPALINLLALTRPILFFDSAGVGTSDGEVVDSFPGWAEHVPYCLPANRREREDQFIWLLDGWNVRWDGRT
jgi:hypothetical protein